ncbi:MAG: 2'-deoxycytidine 5'-triphosphate deaminase, partial [Candidatus Tectomicrobia bacterium]
MSQETGVLPFQSLHHAVREGWIRSTQHAVEPQQFQPASLDLRLGSIAYRIRSSFLPGHENAQKKLDTLTMYDIPLAPSAVLERGHVYLIPLAEELCLPSHIHAKANP